MNSEIQQLMSLLCSHDSLLHPACDLHSSSVKTLNAPVATDLFNDLQTLAEIYNRDANCIAGDLLTIAMKEAFSHLSQEQLNHLHSIRQTNERAEAVKHMEEQRFDHGCT